MQVGTVLVCIGLMQTRTVPTCIWKIFLIIWGSDWNIVNIKLISINTMMKKENLKKERI